MGFSSTFAVSLASDLSSDDSSLSAMMIEASNGHVLCAGN